MENISIPVAFRSYYLLTKPGILMGNAITAIAGFCLALKGEFSFLVFISMLIGLGSVIASACVWNNYIDREADGKMERTKRRPLPAQLISESSALFFAFVLGVFGVLILALFTNLLALLVALIGFFVYVFLYSFSKYHSMHGTLVGSIAGAVPPVVGYCAASGALDMGAALLFSIMVLWQMPHFYAIAIYRQKDYAAASIPVLPIKKGIAATKIHMLFYVAVFAGVSPLLFLFGYTGYGYLAMSLILGLGWLALSIQGFACKNDVQWARQMFLLSLVVITFFSLGMIGPLL